jgi:hypothetical protein
MAGAGYKLFNTGDVLTAAQVNTYLQEQTVMVFANAAARTSALSGVLAEGMISYLKDTNAVEKYDGSAWSAIGTGDIEGVTAGTGLTGGGTSGTVTLNFDVANYGGGSYAAGKNKIINGDFSIWQRGTSFSPASGAATFTADRWLVNRNGTGATVTVSQQSFTAGTAPVSGYESQYFWRYNQSVAGSTGTFSNIATRLEDVRTFAGQTVTISFWAKADASRSITPSAEQYFGSGGSSAVYTNGSAQSLTTSWARFSVTISVPSISGKTLGAGNYLAIYFDIPVNTAMTIDIWGVQLEAGSVATAFQTATGTLQGELAACQRYFETSYNSGTTPGDGAQGSSFQLTGVAITTGQVRAPIFYKVPKRAAATVTFYRTSTGASAGMWTYYNGGNIDFTGMGYDGNQIGFYIQATKTSSFTANNAYAVYGDWIASAEL